MRQAQRPLSQPSHHLPVSGGREEGVERGNRSVSRPMSSGETLCAERETNMSNSCAAAVNRATARQKGSKESRADQFRRRRRLVLRRGEARRRSDVPERDPRPLLWPDGVETRQHVASGILICVRNQMWKCGTEFKHLSNRSGLNGMRLKLV